MKKLFFLLLLSVGFLAASAQLRTMTGPGLMTNGATNYVTVAVSGYHDVISFVLLVTKGSGTVAGTATLEGSHDNTTWAQISTTAATLTDVATQSFSWTVFPSSHAYYRIKVVTTGTQTSTPTGTALVRDRKRG